MASWDLRSIEVMCPKCDVLNHIAITAGDGDGEDYLEINCSKCHALMGKWRDLKRIAEDQERRL